MISFFQPVKETLNEGQSRQMKALGRNKAESIGSAYHVNTPNTSSINSYGANSGIINMPQRMKYNILY